MNWYLHGVIYGSAIAGAVACMFAAVFGICGCIFAIEEGENKYFLALPAAVLFIVLVAPFATHILNQGAPAL